MLDFVKVVRACWELPIIIPDLFLILQELSSKLTELPLLVMRLMETFHVAVIASLLRVCCKIFVWAVLSPLDPAAVILIGDKSDDSVEGQRDAHLVSHCVNVINGESMRWGK